MQASLCNFTKSNNPPLVFLTFLKFYKWYQIAQSISYFVTISSRPKYSCFSRWWPLLGAKKSVPKKLKKQFFSKVKFYSLKAHAHYFTVVIYLATGRAAKLGIFTHFTFTNLSQNINSLIYVYCIQIPRCFL